MTYSDYGAVTKTTGTVDTPFRYAGRLGVITDNNGLVYLKTRYYNPQLMRFMNRDTVAGSVTDSQSLNRFSYVEGNPLTYVDLNGQARTWLTSYDGLHSVLDALGFIPVLGNATAMLSIGLDLATGHYDAVFADAIGLLPLGHVAGVIGGVALAHVASPLVVKLGAQISRRSNAIRKFLAPVDNHGNKVLSRTFFKKGTNEVDWTRLAPNNGELKGSVTSDFTIQTDEKLDRYFSKGFENGRFFGNGIDDFEKRSLPYFEEDMEYQAYKVIKPISGVRRSIAAPAFTRDGGAVQYFIENMDVNYLIENSFIKRI